MIKDLIPYFIIGKRVVLTSSTNNGCSSLALYIANTILDEDKILIYYNPSRDIDRNFVKRFYSRVHSNALWIESSLDSFLDFLQDIGYNYDCLIIDPGDILMIDKELVKKLTLIRRPKSTIILTSQIRQNPEKGWAPYSTIEQVNSFDYSIWLTNITGGSTIYKTKYVDIYNEKRLGTNFIARDIAKFTEEGNIVE